MLDTVYALLRIDYFLASDIQLPEEARLQYYRYIDEYGDLYFSGNYALYTGNLNQEHLFLSSIKAELDYVAGYDDFLENIRNRAQNLSGISLFQGGYDTESIRMAAEAYDALHGVDIDYAPQKGFYTAINYFYTDIILIVSMLIIASVSVREERDNGLIHLVRAAPRGRLATAVGKLLALAVSVFLVLILLYGTNFLFCELTYSLGPLSRSVQSIPFLMGCTLKLSAGQYLAVFLLAKFFAAFIVGIWIMAAALYIKRPFAAWCVSLLFIAAQWVIREVIPHNSGLDMLKHANLAGLLYTNEIIGSYRNLHGFGGPVSIFRVAAIFSVALACVFLLLFVLILCRAQLADTQKKGYAVFKPRPHTTVAREEVYKTMLASGAVVLLAAVFLFQAYRGVNTEYYVGADDIYYRYYMENLEGPYTQDKALWLQQEYDAFAPLLELDRALLRGEITDEEYGMAVSPYYGMQQRMQAFYAACQKAAVIGRTGAHFVYDTGYSILFDFNDATDLNETLLAAVLSVVCFSSFFSCDSHAGMTDLLQATPLGTVKTRRIKVKIAFAVSVCVAGIVSLSKYLSVIRAFGLPAVFSPASSITLLSGASFGAPILLLLLLSFAFRIAACFFMATVVLVLSNKTGNTVITLFLSTVLFCLAPLLAVFGVGGAKMAGIYPFFHIAADVAKITLPGMLALIALIALLIYILHKAFLIEER